MALFSHEHFTVSRKIFGALGTSVILHCLFIFLLASLEPNFVPNNATLLEIEMRYAKSPTPQAEAEGKSKASKILSRTVQNRPLKLRDLGLTPINTASYLHAKGISGDQTELAREWTQPKSYLVDEIHSFENIPPERIIFAKSLWKEIDQSILEPEYLSEYNHTGKVHIFFQINQEGHLLESSLRACGWDSVLKVLAARALRKALRNGKNEIHFSKENLTFYAQFTWSDYETCKSLRGINKNYLSFCHHAKLEAKTFSKSEQISTYLKALQYGTGAIEEIQKYKREESHRKNQFDPFSSLKSDPDWNLEC